MNEKKDTEATCELIIYCYECDSKFQLNTDMMAVALITNATIWEIYEYILTSKCRVCGDKKKY